MNNEEIQELKDILDCPNPVFLIRRFLERKEKELKGCYGMDNCDRINCLYDHDMLDSQLAEAIIKTCENCDRNSTKSL